MDVFDLQAKITLDSKDFERNLGKAAGQMGGFGDEIRGIFDDIGGALAAAFAVDKVKTFVSTAVSEFGRLEQLIGGVDTLFKDSSGALQTLADNAYLTAGMSANEYLDTSMSFAASLISALGGDTAAAVDMVDMAVTDMADNANKMGTDIGSIQHAYQGFAKQNYTMLDNLKLGYGGTKSEMARLINDSGVLGDTIVEISTMTKQGNFDQVVSLATVAEAIHVIQTEWGITGTTAAEAAGTIEGSVASMKAAWSNWLGGLADPDSDMSALTDNLVSSVQTAADNVLPAIGRIGDSLGQVFTDLTGIDLSGVTDSFKGISTAFSEIKTAFSEGGVSGGLDQIAKSFEDMTGLDISDITNGIKKFAEVAGELKTAFENDGFSGVVDSLVQSFKDSTGIDLTGLVDGIRGFIDGFKNIDPQSLQRIADAVKKVIDNLNLPELGTVITQIANALGLFFEKIGTALEVGLPVVADIISFLAEDFPNLASGVVGAATGILTFVAAIKAMEIIQGLPAMLSGFKIALAGVFTLISANPLALFISALGALVAALVTAYNTSEEFRNIVDQVWASIKEGALTALENLKITLGKIGDAISEAAQTVKNKVSEFIQAGRDLIQGLIDEITEKISNIGTAVKNAAGKVVDWFDTAFDRHSPSKVFAEMGRDLMRGLEVGIDDESKNVQRTIDGLRFTAPTIRMGKVDVSQSTMGKMSAAAINNAISLASGNSHNGTSNINLIVDGRTIAQVMFDPLNNLIKQKGVPLGV